MDVPTTIRNTPELCTPAPGTDTNESTLPTATATDVLRPRRAATSARSVPGTLAGGGEARPQFLGRVRKARIGSFEVRPGWQAVARRPASLVTRRAAGTNQRARQVPHDPVGCLDERAHGVVDRAVLLPGLYELGEVPLRREPPAIAGEEALAAFDRHLVQPVRDRLGGVVLPELHPRMQVISPLVELAERCAVLGHRQDGAAGEVDADANHFVRRHLGGRERFGNASVKDLEVISRVLQRGVRWELAAGRGKPLVNDPMAIADLGDCEFFSTAQVEKEHAAGLGSEVDSDRDTPTARRRGGAHAPPTALWCPEVSGAPTQLSRSSSGKHRRRSSTISSLCRALHLRRARTRSLRGLASEALTEPHRSGLGLQRGPPSSTGAFAVVSATQHRFQQAVGREESMASIASSSLP